MVSLWSPPGGQRRVGRVGRGRARRAPCEAAAALPRLGTLALQTATDHSLGHRAPGRNREGLFIGFQSHGVSPKIAGLFMENLNR